MRSRSGVAWLSVLAVLTVSGCTSTPAPRAPAPPIVRDSTPAAIAEPPTPTPAATVASEPTTEAVILTDGQRATLDATFGVGSPLEQQYRDTYCPMDDAGREYYADLVARQLDYEIVHVLTYWAEFCAG